MRLQDLSRWVLSFINSESFLDWLFTSIFGLAMWWAGCVDHRRQSELSVPRWLRFFICKNGRVNGRVYLRSFVMQILGIFMLVASLFVTIFINDHNHRVRVFMVVVFGLMVVAMIFILLQERH